MTNRFSDTLARAVWAHEAFKPLRPPAGWRLSHSKKAAETYTVTYTVSQLQKLTILLISALGAHA